MTTRKYSSRAQQTTLSSSITSGDTSMTVGSGANLMGGKTPGVSETYTVVIDPDTALEEIVDVSNYASGNTLTIARGIDNSNVGVAHSAGAIVRHMVIGRDLSESNTHIEATTGHGATGAVVGTTNTQTLTNKTLTSPTITGTGAIAGTFTGNLTGNVTGNVTGSSGSTTGNAATATALATGRTISLTGDVTGTTGAFDGTAAVTMTAAIGTGVIVNADINASAAIDKTKISGTAVTVADTGTVTSTMLLDGTILNADINASAAIDKTKISGTAITAGDTGTVTSTMLLDGTILNADVNASAAITYSKLNLNGTITSADIVDGTIVAGDIANATITAAKMVTDPYARANHTGTQLAATVSDFDTQVRTSRLDQMAAPTASVALNAQKITGLGTPTANTTDAATTAYVDTQITALVNGAPGILDTLGEIATQIQSGGTFYDSLVLKSGSTMTGALTLSGAPTVGLHAATKTYVDTVAGSATAAAASAAAAAASYDSFDDRYLGAYASNPTLDNDGNALITGAIYFNSVSAVMLAWSGTAWVSISSSAEIYRYKFIAAGGETSVSGADASSQTLAYIAGKEQVYLNGVLLVRGTDYTATNGTSITALAALVVSDVLEIITFTAFSVVTDIPQSIVDVKGDLIVGTAADTVGRLGVGTNGQVLTADSTAGTGLAYTTPISASSTTTFTNKTVSLTSNTVSGTLAEFNTALSGDDFVSLTGAETLTNKTLTNPVIASVINNTLTSTTGDIIYASAANTPARLGIGTTGQVLNVASGVPAWATPAAGGSAPQFTPSITNYYIRSFGSNATFTEQTFSTEVVYYIPIILGAYTYDRLSIVTGASHTGATNTVRLGIYNNDATTNKPSTVLLDAGTVTTVSASTAYEITISQSITTAGLYWLAFVEQTAPVNIGNYKGSAGGTIGNNNGILNTFTSNTSNNVSLIALSESGITGAFATAGTLSAVFSSTKTPIMYIRKN